MIFWVSVDFLLVGEPSENKSLVKIEKYNIFLLPFLLQSCIYSFFDVELEIIAYSSLIFISYHLCLKWYLRHVFCYLEIQILNYKMWLNISSKILVIQMNALVQRKLYVMIFCQLWEWEISLAKDGERINKKMQCGKCVVRSWVVLEVQPTYSTSLHYPALWILLP